MSGAGPVIASSKAAGGLQLCSLTSLAAIEQEKKLGAKRIRSSSEHDVPT